MRCIITLKNLYLAIKFQKGPKIIRKIFRSGTDPEAFSPLISVSSIGVIALGPTKFRRNLTYQLILESGKGVLYKAPKDFTDRVRMTNHRKKAR